MNRSVYLREHTWCRAGVEGEVRASQGDEDLIQSRYVISIRLVDPKSVRDALPPSARRALRGPKTCRGDSSGPRHPLDSLTADWSLSHRVWNSRPFEYIHPLRRDNAVHFMIPQDLGDVFARVGVPYTLAIRKSAATDATFRESVQRFWYTIVHYSGRVFGIVNTSRSTPAGFGHKDESSRLSLVGGCR